MHDCGLLGRLIDGFDRIRGRVIRDFYHRYTVDIYLHFLLLASSNGLSVPRHVVDCVRQMVEFLLAVRQPDGSIPAIGDVDGGALLPLSRRRPEDAAGTFATAAAMFHRSDFAWAANGIAPEVLWLMGLDGLRAFDALDPVPPAGPASRAFPVGGYAIMRNQWDDDASQMIVDIGPLGCPGSSGHGHADLLSVQCAIFGEPCLVDGGNFCYTADAEWRDFFRSTAAHSTLAIDGRTQSEPAGPFGWRERPRVRLREWHSSPQLDFLDAEHDAFSRRGDPIVHRRRILFGGRVSHDETDPRVSAPLLHRDMVNVFPELAQTRVTHSWMGFIAYTFDEIMHVGKHDGVHYAMGYCGSGVGAASYFGMRIGQQVLGRAEGRTALDGLAFQTRPFYTGKPWFLAASIRYYRWRDRRPV